MMTTLSFKQIRINTILERRFIFIILTILIAIILSSRPIPWAQDDLNYLNYASRSINEQLLSSTIQHSKKNPFYFLTNEPLWLFFNNKLSIFFESEFVLRIIIFISVVGVLLCLGALTNHSFLTLILFLFIPQVLKNHVTHLRQGFALSIFLFGFIKGGKIGLFLRLLSPLIHTSFWFTLIIELFECILKKMRLALSSRLMIFTFVSFLLILSIPYVASFLGDRRLDVYQFAFAESSSFLGWTWWLCIGLLFLIAFKKNKYSILCLYGVIFYLVSYFIVDFSARIFENIIPIIIAMALITQKDFKYISVSLLLMYGALEWYMRGGIFF